MESTRDLANRIKTKRLSFNWPCAGRKVNFSFKGIDGNNYNFDFTKTYGIYGIKVGNPILADVVTYEGEIYILDHFRIINPIDTPERKLVNIPERINDEVFPLRKTK